MTLEQAERHRLVEQHLGLARSLAVKIRNRHGLRGDLEELVAWGNAGLVEASTRWDPARGIAFSTFAYYRVRGSIYDGLRLQGLFKRSQLLRFDAGADAVMQDRVEAGGEGAAAGEGGSGGRSGHLAGALGEIAAVYVISLDDDNRPEQADPHPEDVVEQLDTRQAGADVRRAIRGLPERERKLIQMHYFQQMSLTEAGERIGLSRSWACRLHARAVRRLAGLLAAPGVKGDR